MSLDLDHRPDGPHGPPDSDSGGLRRRLLTAVAVVAALALALVAALQLSGGVRPAVQRVLDDTPVAPAETTMLSDLWASYTERFLEEGTHRTLDPSQGGVTTSEGQSYTMMRAAWMDDRTTFDQSWQWTKDNIQRPDRLMSWRFGQRPDGTYGVQTDQGGQNAASDADVDIAYSLLMAYSRWSDDDYLYDALPVIQAVWAEEVVDVAGSPVLAANDLERGNQSVLVNPSYLAPYAYRAFARVDPTHDWNALVDSSYNLLDRVSTQPLDGVAAAGLAPDWVRLDRTTGALSAATDVTTAQGTSNGFGYEALRLPWRLALDARWNDEPRATALLDQQGRTLAASWRSTGSLAAVSGHDGRPAVDYPSLAMYGGAVGALDAADPAVGRQVYERELLPVYDPDTRGGVDGLGYYDANWAWFGLALHLDRLPDLNDPAGSDLP